MLDFKDKFEMSIDYIFGKDVSSVIPLKELDSSFSKRTSKLKTVSLEGKLFATIRSDGSIALTVFGASLLLHHPVFLENCVVIEDGPDKFVSEGGSVFAQHVIRCGRRIRPASDVVVLNKVGEVIAVGRAILSANMIMKFEKGMAVKVRETR
jgi:uncharacterized protein with predicted RNA binding PUA domain